MKRCEVNIYTHDVLNEPQIKCPVCGAYGGTCNGGRRPCGAPATHLFRGQTYMCSDHFHDACIRFGIDPVSQKDAKL